MNAPTSVTEIEMMIQDQVQESIHLDYKDSRAIHPGARDDIAKDVSAFANSDGGLLIYGVTEKDQLPTGIDDGVPDKPCSREWIEAAIMTGITPRLNDVRILPLPIKPGHSLYVIEVAKTFRGPHQASDKRFYKRHNFKSVPMENYEIDDVRSRRKRLSPMITFEVGEYQRFTACFDVGNVADSVAEEVRFEFSVSLPWPNGAEMPYLFSQGISKFPPKQKFRFLFFPFSVLLSGARGVPTEFSVRISYNHPDSDSRVTDEWPVNFAAYMNSMGVHPESEDHAKDLVEGIGKLNQHLASLQRTIERFTAIHGSTGLDLSIPTLRNIRRVVMEGQGPEPIDPRGCDWRVFRELLGVDHQMAFQISQSLHSQNTIEPVRAISGMTGELLAKIQAAFIIEGSAASEHQGE